MNRDEKRRWLDEPRNVTRLYRGLWAIGIALLLLDPVVHRHEEFGFAAWLGYYAVFGFVACCALVLAAKEILRRLVARPENYYDDR
jgi:hypothetical protein